MISPHLGTGKVRNSESERREYTQEVDLREPTGLKRDLEHQHAHDSWTGGNGLGGLRARSAARLPDSARSTLVRQPDALRNTCPEVLEGPGSHDGTSDTVSGNCAARQVRSNLVRCTGSWKPGRRTRADRGQVRRPRPGAGIRRREGGRARPRLPQSAGSGERLFPGAGLSPARRAAQSPAPATTTAPAGRPWAGSDARRQALPGLLRRPRRRKQRGPSPVLARRRRRRCCRRLRVRASGPARPGLARAGSAAAGPRLSMETI